MFPWTLATNCDISRRRFSSESWYKIRSISGLCFGSVAWPKSIAYSSNTPEFKMTSDPLQWMRIPVAQNRFEHCWRTVSSRSPFVDFTKGTRNDYLDFETHTDTDVEKKHWRRIRLRNTNKGNAIAKSICNRMRRHRHATNYEIREWLAYQDRLQVQFGC